MENWLHAAAFYMNAAESFYYVDPSGTWQAPARQRLASAHTHPCVGLCFAVTDAIKFYLAAISQYTSIGRFGTAAKCQVEIAKLYEQVSRSLGCYRVCL